ncbi:MAG TPA: sugar transferase [Acidobacteriaceae bacterium]|nr:sugar transferase [Acidobacteriaceae bacterium]
MSSLSFDSLFPAETDNPSRPAHQSEQAAVDDPMQTARRDRATPAPWKARTVSEASPWILSAVRRTFDCFAALAALLVFLPFMVFAAALVRFGSQGPVFFRQKRMGRGGKEFTLYKFRSMDQIDGSASNITVAGDARITPVGAFLRRYKLDELPQFWNVLTGDMSLVGPRPKLPHHEALHMACRPGITGVATLAFRKEEEFLSGIPEHELEAFYELFVKPAKARMDIDYIRTATFVSDFLVLWRTAASCAFGSAESLAIPAEIVARHASTWAVSGNADSSGALLSRSSQQNSLHAAGLRSEI